MEPGIKMLAEHEEFDVKPVHRNDDGRAFLTGSAVEVFGGVRAGEIGVDDWNGWARQRSGELVDEEQGRP